MRPTRRGYAVAAVALLAVLLSAHSGPRSLNAVAAPAIVVLAAATVHLARRDHPDLSRRTPAPGFPGTSARIELDVGVDGPATVRDEVEDGLGGGETVVRVDGEGTASYDVERRRRGAHQVGPATVTERDPLDLLGRETTVRGRDAVLVYPAVVPIVPNRALQGLVEHAGTRDREAFDRLREYVSGDALRDVDWKSSAKRPGDDLVVTEFARRDEGGLTVAAEADAGHGDEMARAAASVAVHLLNADLAVGVVAPGGRVDQARGEDQRERVFELLARTPAGRVGDRVDPDVRIRADDEGVHVTANDRTTQFSALRDPDRPEFAQGVVPA
jgi:uncharacterized protein (DUF58 family)